MDIIEARFSNPDLGRQNWYQRDNHQQELEENTEK